ncbi:MAG: sigma-70 family RNA polymerase sigma factor [Planctomycetaceae bacterium]
MQPPDIPACVRIGSPLDDRTLLRRFVQDADEQAFTEIVQRYQRLVMSVCRRVLRQTPDAEDAFQATFLALAARPVALKKSSTISSWLYTVAWRVSWRIVRQRLQNASVNSGTGPLDPQPGPLEKISAEQEALALDKELNRLPEKYREVLIMNYFAGQSSQQIADELNISRGTVDGRLRRARNELRIRLTRRGISIGVLLIAANQISGATGAPPASLVSSTISSRLQWTDGLSAAKPSSLQPFIQPELTMINIKLMTAGVLLTAGLAGLVGMAMSDSDRSHNTNSESAAAATPVAPLPVIEVRNDSPGETEPAPASADTATTTRQASEDSAAPAKDFPQRAAEPLNLKFSAVFPDAPAKEKWLHEMLNKPIPVLDFAGETPLSEILETLQAHYTTEFGTHAPDGQQFKLAFVPDVAELELDGVTSLEDILIKDIHLEGLTLRSALELIFEQTSEPRLTYAVQNEVTLVTTQAKAEADIFYVTRVYEVGKLVHLSLPAPPFRTQESPSEDPGKAPKDPGPKRITDGERDLATLIIEMVGHPVRWVDIDGEGGAVRLAGSKVVVRQNPRGHEAVVRLLNELSR